MSTILFPSPIFGPVRSRRLGISLGINLMPADGKVCTFDCIYCECGLNAERRPTLPRPTREEVAEALEKKLREMADEGQLPDVLTFAGNGEPTTHPHFAAIIDDTIRLRNQYCPKAKVSVLSNATQLHRPDVFEALLRVDNNIQKLDTVDMDFIRAVDRPTSPSYDVKKVVEPLKARDCADDWVQSLPPAPSKNDKGRTRSFRKHCPPLYLERGRGRGCLACCPEGNCAAERDDLHHRPRNARRRTSENAA